MTCILRYLGRQSRGHYLYIMGLVPTLNSYAPGAAIFVPSA
jgi:hypothetical protein